MGTISGGRCQLLGGLWQAPLPSLAEARHRRAPVRLAASNTPSGPFQALSASSLLGTARHVTGVRDRRDRREVRLAFADFGGRARRFGGLGDYAAFPSDPRRCFDDWHRLRTIALAEIRENAGSTDRDGGATIGRRWPGRPSGDRSSAGSIMIGLVAAAALAGSRKCCVGGARSRRLVDELLGLGGSKKASGRVGIPDAPSLAFPYLDDERLCLRAHEVLTAWQKGASGIGLAACNRHRSTDTQSKCRESSANRSQESTP